MSMKASLANSEDSNSIEKRSDLIKAELAKFRLLKSKGSFGGNEDMKENKPFIKNSFSVGNAPQKDENSYSSGTILLPSNYSHLSGTYSKSEIMGSSAKKLTEQSHSDHPGVLSSNRDRGKSDVHSFTSHLRDTPTSQASRNKSPTPGKLSTPQASSLTKKSTSAKTTVFMSEEKSRDIPWSQIEAFVDTELEKDLFTKVQAKTTKNASTKPVLPFSKSQSGWGKKALDGTEKRASSAMDGGNGKNIRDNKNNTPSSFKASAGEEKARKSSVPGSPNLPLADDVPNRKRSLLTPNPDSRPMASQKEKRNTPSIIERGPSPKRLPSPKPDLPTEKSLKEEVEKWRIFGKMMAESYDDLNKKYTDYTKDREKDKKIIDALKDQINTLKALLKASKEENSKIKELSSKSTSESSSRAGEDRDVKELKELAHLSKELEEFKAENKETLKMVEFLKDENEALKKTVEENIGQKTMVEHYQKLADARFKECSALAEEIICLRTDLDRSHSNYLRIQREQGSGKKMNGDSFYSAKKLNSASSNLAKHKKWSDKKVQDWNFEADDQPPSPTAFSVLPSKEESTNIEV